MSNRNEVIDLIRGFSILAVILLHCKIHLPLDESLLSFPWIKWLLFSGHYGVMTFFVVSGYLITSNCLRKWGDLQSIRISQFYLMRISRIVPPLVALLAILSLLHIVGIKPFVIHNTTLYQALFSAFTFRINWLESKIGYLPANWDVLWSLSVEEVFYLFFPLLCLLLRKKRYIILMASLFIILGPLSRTQFTDNVIWTEYAYLSGMDGIAIGCLAALFANQVRPIQSSTSLLLLGFVLFGFIFFFRKLAYHLGITPLGLNVTILDTGIALMILATQQTHFRWFSLIRWFGRNSYEIYLSHGFIVLFAASILYRMTQPTWLIALEYTFVALCSGFLGQLIATYYSEPFNRYLRSQKSQRSDLEFNV